MKTEVLDLGKIVKISSRGKTFYVTKTFMPFKDKLFLGYGEGIFMVNTVNGLIAYPVFVSEDKAKKFSDLTFSGAKIVISGKPVKNLCLFNEFLVPQVYPRPQSLDEFIEFLNSFMSSVGNGMLIYVPNLNEVKNIQKHVEVRLKKITKDYFKPIPQLGIVSRPIEVQTFYDTMSRYLFSSYLILVTLLSNVEISVKRLFKKTMNIIDWLVGKGFKCCFSSKIVMEKFLKIYNIVFDDEYEV